jgi:hypothetical protein
MHDSPPIHKFLQLHDTSGSVFLLYFLISASASASSTASSTSLSHKTCNLQSGKKETR